ncbi:MAG TPA: hypothetical protein VES65_05210 [Solirubrobacteraceae bacterium]|nr:hypothetical protein [Solirubrobacteraceae bacterium]
MRPTDLLPPILSERHSLRRRRKRAAAANAVAPTPVSKRDLAVARVREAGGPVDNASYACACGLVFAAAVSTTVVCPRCGARQAW